MAYLSPLDYAVLVVFLLFSGFVGLYHGCTGGRQRSAQEYLLANRNMHPVPVAVSITVSVLSAVTYIGTPAEVYIHGPQFWVISLNKIIPISIVTFAFCPLFYRLRVTSIYEYLDMRFGRAVRYIGVAINVVYLILYMGIVVYAPALALNAVTGISLAGSILAVGVVCTFYTTIGGITAVVWTDVFQSIVMLAGFLVTIIACCVDVGGFLEVFRVNIEDGRGTFFDFRLNPTIRHSFWSIFVGLGVMMTSYVGTNQIIVQRYMTCRSLRQSQLAVGLGTLLMGAVELTAVFAGMCMYAYYAGCDPLTAGMVQRADQLMAYIMVDLFRDAPGVAGLLISAAFSASLSTVSSGVNALATMTGQDLIRGIWPDLADFKFTLILKCISILFGVTCIAMAFLVSKLDDLIPITLSLVGIMNGPVLGVFSLGAFFPRANSKGAIVGMVSAVLLALWCKIGSMLYPPHLDDPPLYVDQCETANASDAMMVVDDVPTHYWDDPVNSSVIAPTEDIPGIARFYALSYAYYTPLTCVTTMIVGLLVSALTANPTDPPVPGRLISPAVRSLYCCLPETMRAIVDDGIDDDDDGDEPEDMDMKPRSSGANVQ